MTSLPTRQREPGQPEVLVAQPAASRDVPSSRGVNGRSAAFSASAVDNPDYLPSSMGQSLLSPAQPRNRRPRRLRKLSTSQIFDELERFSRRTISTTTYSSTLAEEVSDVLLGRDDDDEEAARGGEEEGVSTEPGEDQDVSKVSAGGEVPHRDRKHTISNFETAVHIFKGNIGIGILTLPMAIRNSGLIFGSIGIALIALVCVSCMHMLVNAAHKACHRRPGVIFLDFADTAEATFIDAGGRWTPWAPFIRRLVNIFLVLTQLFSNAVYVLFIAQNVQPIFIHYGGEFFHSLNYRFYILFLLPPMILVCFVRNLRYLSPFSVLATVAQAVSIGIIFYYLLFSSPIPNSHSVPWISDFARLPLFFGTAIFAIEGICVVLPIENQMRNPQAIKGWNGVLSTTMTLITVSYIAMGFYGFLKYGENVKASITLNLPSNDALAEAVLVLFSFAIFFSYTLQFYVLIDVLLRNWVTPRISEGWRRDLADYLLRVVVNLITFALAATVPWLDLVVSLLGAVKMSTLALMVPAVLDTASHWDRPGYLRLRFVRNGLIFMIGLFGCVVGTSISVMRIIENFAKE